MLVVISLSSQLWWGLLGPHCHGCPTILILNYSYGAVIEEEEDKKDEDNIN